MTTFPTAEVLMSLVIDIAAKGGALLAIAWLACKLLRRESAAVRHSVWSMTMLALIVLPLVSWALPAWRLPILPANESAEPAADYVTPVAPLATSESPAVTPAKAD